MYNPHFNYSNFLLYHSGLFTVDIALMNVSELEAILSDLDIERYPIFSKYFHETLNYEKSKLNNYNLQSNVSIPNSANGLKLYLNKNIYNTALYLSIDSEYYEVNYQFDKLLYFEFFKNVLLDDYMEKHLKRKSYFIVKYDLLSNQEIELRLNLIQKFLIKIIKNNPYPIGDILNSIISNNLIPNISLERHHKNFLFNELKPLIYWGFFISKKA